MATLERIEADLISKQFGQSQVILRKQVLLRHHSEGIYIKVNNIVTDKMPNPTLGGKCQENDFL